MADTPIIIQSWQLLTGFVIFIITVVGTTYAISKFIHTMKGDIRVFEVKVQNYEKDLKKYNDDLSKLVNLFLDEGFRIFTEKAKGDKPK